MTGKELKKIARRLKVSNKDIAIYLDCHYTHVSQVFSEAVLTKKVEKKYLEAIIRICEINAVVRMLRRSENE